LVLEVGSGSGYLGDILKRNNVNVICSDPCDVREELGPSNDLSKKYTDIEKLTAHDAIQKYHEVDTLLMSWPFMHEWANDALNQFKGATFIYLGDPKGHGCATDSFFETLASDFEEKKVVGVETDYHLHRVVIYKRKEHEIKADSGSEKDKL
jgi:hypothetical protein